MFAPPATAYLSHGRLELVHLRVTFSAPTWMLDVTPRNFGTTQSWLVRPHPSSRVPRRHMGTPNW